ncbi:MAG: DEAD/DEAH box helicase family protein, partial [Victivallales bacterium]|nr:DEAD/DEAH box helicase family protein [Victivallales bacterium]
LIARSQNAFNGGKGLTPEEERILEQHYYSSMDTYPPRYYQRIAINRTLDAIARGRKRLLLVMATGTGKTYTAFQIVWRLLKCGMVKKVLYLADRNALIKQTINDAFKPLEKVQHRIIVAKEDKAALKSYQVYFSLYQ